MNLYSLSLAIGAVGLLAMALTGLGRHGHGHGHVGSKLGHARASHAPSPGRGTHHSHGGTARATATAWLWSLTSPRVLFSLLIGFGTTGVLVRGALAGPLAFGAAMAGGVLFEQLLVGPVWNFLMRFASAPLSRWRAASRTKCARPRASMRMATVWSPPKSMDKSCNC